MATINGTATDNPVTHHADEYFEGSNVESWSLRDFLGEKPDKKNNDALLGSWKRALHRIEKDKTNPTQMTKAKQLLLSYAEDKMSIFSDKGLDDNQPTPPVIFNQNGSHATQNITFIGDKRKRQPEHKRGKGKERKTKKLRLGFLDNFKTRYSLMENLAKWKLPTGVFAEDLLFKTFQTYEVEHPAHSYIIDPHDEEVKKCFTPEDWAYIYDHRPKLPELDTLFHGSLTRFAEVKSLADLSFTLRTTSYFSSDDLALEYDLFRSKYHGPCWLDSEMRHILELYHSNRITDKENLENWFTIHVWSALDRAIMSLDIQFSRGESLSTCSSDRKNSAPVTKASRKKPSPRYDGLLRYNKIEIGAAEHARNFESETGRKWTSDTLKLVKVLRDMLVHLQQRAPTDREFQDVQVLGFVAAELCCQAMTMKYAGGNITILTKHPSQEFPTTIKGIGKLFLLLMNLWSLRSIVENTKKTIDGFTSVDRIFQLANSANDQQRTHPPLEGSVDTDVDTSPDTVA